MKDSPHSHAHGGHDAWNALIHDPERVAQATPETTMPLFQGMMKGGCRACPKEQTRVCQNLEKPFNVIGHDLIEPWLGMPWHFKAQDIIGGGASDGGVPHDDVREIIRAIESTARRNGHDTVSLGDIVETVATTADDFSYRAPAGTDQEFASAVESMGVPSDVIARGNRESRQRAEFYRSDPAAMRANAMEIVAALPFEGKVHDWLAARDVTWCSHVPHLYSRMMWRTGIADDEILPLFDMTEAIAAERGHPGVTPRDVETAFMRAAAAGISKETAAV